MHTYNEIVETHATWIKSRKEYWIKSYYSGNAHHVETLKKRHWLLFWLPKWKVVKHNINGVVQ